MDIKGLEIWENDTKEWNKKAGRLKTKAGIGLIDALETYYAACQLKKTPANVQKYMTWRLRLHLKFNHDLNFLRELDDTFAIGLQDDTIGKTFFEYDLPTEESGRFGSGYNWRRDSGEAIRGRSKPNRREYNTDLGEC